MEVPSPINKKSAGLTVMVSAGVVACFGLFEVGGLAWAFATQSSQSPQAKIHPPAMAMATRPAEPAQKGTGLEDPLAAGSLLAEAEPMPEAVFTPIIEQSALPKPTPIPISRK